jgi:uncharacterized Zn finger protein
MADTLPDDSPGSGVRLHSATLWCESCGRFTSHRILRLRPSTRPTVRGLARCRECQLTHPFESSEARRVELALIVSRGTTSTRSTISVSATRRVQVGSGLEGSDAPVTVRRIEDWKGQSRPHATASEVRTVWATRDEGAIVPVSVVAGRHTESERLALPHGTRLRVGDELNLAQESVEIVGLRALGRTWRRWGDEFSADEVSRVYARRTSMPPAGRRPWRIERESSSSRASAISAASRSRSAPGTRRARTVPRERKAAGGAAVQSRSPP